jgi:hypothetical protein
VSSGSGAQESRRRGRSSEDRRRRGRCMAGWPRPRGEQRQLDYYVSTVQGPSVACSRIRTGITRSRGAVETGSKLRASTRSSEDTIRDYS